MTLNGNKDIERLECHPLARFSNVTFSVVTCGTIAQSARDLVISDRSTVFLVDHTNMELFTKVADGTQTIRIPLRMGIAGFVASTGQLLNIQDA